MNNKYEILTEDGFKPFSRLNEKVINSYYVIKCKNIITLEEFELKVTGNHKIKVGNNFKKAAYIKIGTMLSDICVVENKKRVRKKLKVYDILDIKDTNSFLSKNGICLHNCEEGFLASVMPVVSSSKTSQIIIVSTPHGMNNEYYRIWNRAQLDLDSNKDGLKWTPVRIDWYDVPGRDEKWKQEQLITFNNDMAKFLQEYGCSFSGSVETLILHSRIDEFKKRFQDKNFLLKPYMIQLHKDYPKTTIHMYKPPQPNHAYICGADPSSGTNLDYQAMSIWDITNPLKIELVASFYENDVPPKLFSYIIAKSATLYNKAYVAMESNGISYATLSPLMDIFEYDNVCHIGGNPKTSIGIHSNSDRKLEACLNFKEICESPFRDVLIYDGRLIEEMEQYERTSRPGRAPQFGNSTGHDDLMTSAIWAFYIIKNEYIEQYYDVKKSVIDKLGNNIPTFVVTSESQHDIDEATKNMMDYIDNKFTSISNKQEISLNQLEMSVTASQTELMNNFLSQSNVQSLNNSSSNNITNEDDYETFIGGFKT